MEWENALQDLPNNYQQIYEYYEMILDTMKDDETNKEYYLLMFARACRLKGEPYTTYKKHYQTIMILYPDALDPIYELALFTPNIYDSILLYGQCISIIESRKSMNWERGDPDIIWKIYYQLVIENYNLGYYETALKNWQHLLSINKCPARIMTNCIFEKNANRSYEKFRESLQPLRNNIATIPNIIHFIWVKGDRAYSMIHYITIRAALDIQKPEKLYIYNDIPPNNEWWEKTKTCNNVEIITVTPPTIINCHPIPFAQHIADIMRICILYERGGMYIDSDLLFIKPIITLKSDIVNMCQEMDHKLWNGFIATPPKMSFMNRWIREYETKYGDPEIGCWWAGASVETPMRLNKQTPGEINILPRELMLPFGLYDDHIYRGEYVEGLYPNSCGVHLWETVAGRRGVLPQNERYFIEYPNTPFTRLFEKYVNV